MAPRAVNARRLLTPADPQAWQRLFAKGAREALADAEMDDAERGDACMAWSKGCTGSQIEATQIEGTQRAAVLHTGEKEAGLASQRLQQAAELPAAQDAVPSPCAAPTASAPDDPVRRPPAYEHLEDSCELHAHVVACLA